MVGIVATNSSMRSNEAQRPGLIAIPAEIRNRIYYDVLIREEDIEFGVIRQGIVEPHLLATCRQIRNETLPIFYGDNTFASGAINFTCVQNLIAYMPMEKLPMLRRLKIIGAEKPLDGSHSWMVQFEWTAKRLVREQGANLLCLDALLLPAFIGKSGMHVAPTWVTLDQLKDLEYVKKKYQDPRPLEYEVLQWRKKS